MTEASRTRLAAGRPKLGVRPILFVVLLLGIVARFGWLLTLRFLAARTFITTGHDIVLGILHCEDRAEMSAWLA
ncbi:MAG TPA: hypothetical protein VKQ30_16325 [Ktedonobacterales bacterium]|nr:hypothetical protein [Ktedonobacterales bacterium]